MKPIRSCPICPDCGSKQFHRIPDKKVIIKCRSCNKEIEI